MKLDKFFDEKTIVNLSFFNFSNAVTAAYFANRNLEVLRVNKNFKKFGESITNNDHVMTFKPIENKTPYLEAYNRWKKELEKHIKN